MKLEKGSHNYMILNHLKKGRTINKLQAFKLYGCMCLAQRVADLRNKYDIPIGDKWVNVTSNTGTKRAKQYFITKY